MFLLKNSITKKNEWHEEITFTVPIATPSRFRTPSIRTRKLLPSLNFFSKFFTSLSETSYIWGSGCNIKILELSPCELYIIPHWCTTKYSLKFFTYTNKSRWWSWRRYFKKKTSLFIYPQHLWLIVDISSFYILHIRNNHQSRKNTEQYKSIFTVFYWSQLYRNKGQYPRMHRTDYYTKPDNLQ